MQDRETVNRRLLDEYNCYPVYLSDELADSHYNGKSCPTDNHSRPAMLTSSFFFSYRFLQLDPLAIVPLSPRGDEL